MKRYIKANTSLNTGSYLLAQNGDMISVQMHVPSTTYQSRGIEHLCPTDAEFLMSQDLLSEEEALVVYYYCLYEYLGRQEATLVDKMKFNSYAELKYAPTLSKLIMSSASCPVSLEELDECFLDIDDEFYQYCKDNFVKVSVMNNSVEFRISSDTGFNWNKVIIDKCILRYDTTTNSTTRYTIVRESSKGYKAYFIGATLKEILENDSVVLSSTMYSRKMIDGRIHYVEI